jgi:hypothetical protein
MPKKAKDVNAKLGIEIAWITRQWKNKTAELSGIKPALGKCKALDAQLRSKLEKCVTLDDYLEAAGLYKPHVQALSQNAEAIISGKWALSDTVQHSLAFVAAVAMRDSRPDNSLKAAIPRLLKQAYIQGSNAQSQQSDQIRPRKPQAMGDDQTAAWTLPPLHCAG